MGSEPTVSATQARVVTLITSKTSGRLHAIHFDSVKLGTQQIGVALLQTLSEERANEGQPFIMAKQIVGAKARLFLDNLKANKIS